MDPELRAGTDRAKANLDTLASALDRVVTDPEIRKRLDTHPIETLTELGFELDDKDRDEILEELIVARTSGLAFPKFKALVKSGVKSAVKVGVESAVSTGVKTVIAVEKSEGTPATSEEPEGRTGAAQEPERKPGKE